MSSISIHEFEHTEENEEKYASHGLSTRAIDQVLNNHYKIVPNRKNRKGSHLVIGRDDGGQCITIAIAPGLEPGRWRPITAWRCKDHEEAVLKRKGDQHGS